MKLSVKTLDAGAAGDIDLKDEIFGIAEIRKDILARMVNYQLAKRRAGTHKTKSRGEVSRTHSKLYKQKGTGNARHGSANAPIFRGGGHAHNRLPRDYEHALPKKVRALALRHALSAKAGAKELIVVDTLAVKDPKTKAVRAQLEALGAANALIIGGAELDLKFALAARNIPNIDVLPSAGLNVYDILRRKQLILTKDAVDAINARFRDGEAPEQKAPRKRAQKAEA